MIVTLSTYPRLTPPVLSCAWVGAAAQAQAVELLCRCDDIADDGVELRVLKGLLTAATSSHIHLHGQVRPLPRSLTPFPFEVG